MKELLWFAAALLVLGCSDNKEHHKLSREDLAYLDAIHNNDSALSAPGFMDWRAQHTQKIQTFEDYVNGQTFVPEEAQQTIYLQPIGTFTELQKKAIERTREYVAIFFQRKAVVLETLPDSGIPADSRRENWGHEQLKTGYILQKILAPNIPDDAFAVMAISEKDLYPSDDLNFVFGQASYQRRIGVTSIYRLQDELLTEANFAVCAKRLLNVSSHEIGHMLTLHHCLFAKCAMNGSNNLDETDASPNRLCSDCQRKLTWNLDYDNRKRLNELKLFFEKNSPDDATYMQKDSSALTK